MKFRTLNYQRRLMASYCAATENEIAVDKLILEIFDFTPQAIGFLPRPSKWIQYVDKYSSCLYIFSFLARHIWICGGGILFFLYQFFQIWLKAKDAPISSIDDVDDARYVLAFTSRVGDILHSDHIQNLPNKWITMPWVPLRKIPSNATRINVFSLLSNSDIWNALWLSIKSVYVLHKRQRTSSWSLQSYTAFRWFIVRLALDKLSGEFIMVEHYDRWAILADSSIQAFRNYKSSDSQRSVKNLTLVQHGALSDIAHSDTPLRTTKLKLPRKLRRVKKLITYNAQSKALFIENILSASCIAKGIDVSYYQPRIELTTNNLTDKVVILFVGHTLCEHLQQQIMLSLENNNLLKAYYKPHPISPMSATIIHSKWEIILDNNYFPEVDLLISYPSTLVTEYAAHNIPSLIHPINLSSGESINFIVTVHERIDRVAQEKFPNNISK